MNIMKRKRRYRRVFKKSNISPKDRFLRRLIECRRLWKLYYLYDPRNGKPFYVGITYRLLGQRLDEHIAGAFKKKIKKKTVKDKFMRTMLDQGYNPQVKMILSGLTYNEADHQEKSHVSNLKRNGDFIVNGKFKRTRKNGSIPVSSVRRMINEL